VHWQQLERDVETLREFGRVGVPILTAPDFDPTTRDDREPHAWSKNYAWAPAAGDALVYKAQLAVCGLFLTPLVAGSIEGRHEMRSSWAPKKGRDLQLSRVSALATAGKRCRNSTGVWESRGAYSHSPRLRSIYSRRPRTPRMGQELHLGTSGSRRTGVQGVARGLWSVSNTTRSKFNRGSSRDEEFLGSQEGKTKRAVNAGRVHKLVAARTMSEFQ